MLKKSYYRWFFFHLILGLMFVSFNTQATTFYVSSSTGNDANDGLSEATAWQTLNKVNETLFADGSILLFKRGDIFRGEISTNKSPKAMTFGAYGIGENPVIAGSLPITGWSPTSHPSLNKSVYEANVSTLPLTEKGIHYLFVNGELMTIARYPNVDSPDSKNWLKVGATAGTDGFTDPALIAYAKPDGYWVGATLRIRNYSWTFNILPITNYTAANGKIVAKGLGNQLPEWGYFLDGKLEELDHPGEWYYDASTKKVYLYPKAGTDPNNSLIEGATYSTGITLSNFENDTVVENLTFRHYLEKGAHISQSDRSIVRNCRFEHNAIGLATWNNVDVLITSNTFDRNFRDAIGLQAAKGFDVKNSIVEKNTVTNTAIYPAYGRRYEGIYEGIGISVFGKAYTVRRNVIENTCWNGIYLKDEGHHLIENNIIRKSLAVLNDGGAISIGSDGNTIRGNILTESIGNVDESNGCGTVNNTPCMHHPSYGMGIGADSKYQNNIIERNVVANNPDMGIRLNSFINTIVRNNIIYNNDPQIAVEDKKGPSSNNLIENNIIYSLGPDQIGLSLTGKTNHGSFNKNYYGNPYSRVVVLRDEQRYSLAHWQRDFPQYDQASKAVHYPFPEYTIVQAEPNLITNSFFEVDIAGWSPARSPKISHEPSKAELDGGSLKAEYSGSGNLTIVSNTLSILQDQWYRLKFSVIANDFGRIQLRLNRTAPETLILEERYFAMDTTRRDYEMVFPAKETTDSAKILFITDETSAKNYWLDNVTFEPVLAQLNNAQEYSKLFINSTENPQAMDLAGVSYLDLDGQPVTQLTLEPFSAKILIYAGGDIPSPPPSSLTLTVTKAGTGSGTITASAGLGQGISCGAKCVESYASGSAVTLTATPDSGSEFVSWLGCSPAFTITNNMNCTATFNLSSTQPPSLTLTIAKGGTGSGNVTAAAGLGQGIACGQNCVEHYTPGSTVTLVATPDRGSEFAGWSGCSGSFQIASDTLCTATFNLSSVPPPSPFMLTITKTGTGSGIVTAPAGLGQGVSCGLDCTENYNPDSIVNLVAIPDTGSEFAGWSGCSPSFKITSDMNCTATFNLSSSPTLTLTILKAGGGSGIITAPTGLGQGISCGQRCVENYVSGSTITLTTTPDDGSKFTGWADCLPSFTITRSMSCTATFDLVSPTDDLPSTGDQSKSINIRGQFGTSPARFFGGTSLDGTHFMADRQAVVNQMLLIKARITVAPADIGKKADLLLVVGVEQPPEPYDGGVGTEYVAVNGRGEFTAVDLYAGVSQWMSQLTDPFESDVILQENVELNIGEVPFTVKSMYYLFVGYRLTGGTIIYTPTPIKINIR